MVEPNDDPVYRHSLREAIVALVLWGLCGLYTITFCYAVGYGDSQAVETIAGIPSWIFYGVVTPWLIVNVFAVWYCFFFVTDDDLGEDPHQESPSEG